jgi:hypothetical protein
MNKFKNGNSVSGTGDCKIIGNRATVLNDSSNGFERFFSSKLVQKSVENRCSIPNYFANRSNSVNGNSVNGNSVNGNSVNGNSVNGNSVCEDGFGAA